MPDPTGGTQYRFLRTAEQAADDAEPLIGIALSGGGVRAACLGLGALQRAEEVGVFQRAGYISAVSGGSYVATAFVASRTGEEVSAEEPLPWQRGSAEEAHLRRNLRYLAEDWPDQCLALGSYLVRTAIHLAQFAAGLVLVASCLSLVYRWTGSLTADGDLLVAGHTAWRYGAAVVLLLVGAKLETSARSARGRLPARLHLSPRRLRLLVMALVGVLVIPDLAALGARVLDATWAGPEFIGVPGLALVLAASGLAALLLRTQGSLDRSRLRKVASQVLRAVFTLAVVVIFTVPPLLLISWQSTHEDGRHIVEWSVAASAAVLAFCGLFVHANQTSLHSTYARRLARAYLVRAGAGASPPVRLADVGLDDLSWEGPQLLVCAAVNVGAGESAQGEGCTSFVFSHDYCGFPTRPANFVDGLAGKPLVDLVAASGAAIAPNMGRFTRESARALLALLNLRLGLWIRVPGDRQGGPRPHTSRLLASLVDRWHEPGPLWTWREAFGAVSQDYDALFVSDGGHWDNSGIIELMRRRCQTIFAVDAAVDDARVANLLRAVSLARSELGVEIMANFEKLDSHEPVIRMRFAYPEQADGAHPTPRNQLIVMRTHVTTDMPADLVALSKGPGAFPRHVTVNQFLLARDVDAYVTLGRWLFDRANEEADLVPQHGRQPDQSSSASIRAALAAPSLSTGW